MHAKNRLAGSRRFVRFVLLIPPVRSHPRGICTECPFCRVEHFLIYETCRYPTMVGVPYVGGGVSCLRELQDLCAGSREEVGSPG